MADELDLEKGDPDAADRITAVKEKTPLKAQGGGRRQSGETGRQRVETELHAQLTDVFNKIAEMLDAREDDELATAIRDNTKQMTQGFVSLTRNVKPLRGPLVLLLNLIQPTLAFWHVGSILGRRWYARRVSRAEAAYQEQQAAEVPA